jgi:hypothetical protein
LQINIFKFYSSLSSNPLVLLISPIRSDRFPVSAQATSILFLLTPVATFLRFTNLESLSFSFSVKILKVNNFLLILIATLTIQEKKTPSRASLEQIPGDLEEDKFIPPEFREA